jgi:hypothetical protein
VAANINTKIAPVTGRMSIARMRRALVALISLLYTVK